MSACRPNQWIKNLIVFSAPLFSFSIESQIWLCSLNAFVSFCLISSSIYLINDSIDKKNDQNHPRKKLRAIASGAVSIKSALVLATILFFLSLFIGFNLKSKFILILIIYFLLQNLYCIFLKSVPLIEIFCVASGFILRSTGGAVASNILISPWFLLSVLLLSLFLAIEKRKAELLIFHNSKILTRKVLKTYTLPLMNKFESVLTSCTIMTYSLWAYGPVIGGAKSPWMILTIPLTILGVFRYQMLSEVQKDNINNNILETPENVILKDKPMQLIFSTWLIFIISIGLLT